MHFTSRNHPAFLTKWVIWVTGCFHWISFAFTLKIPAKRGLILRSLGKAAWRGWKDWVNPLCIQMVFLASEAISLALLLSLKGCSYCLVVTLHDFKMWLFLVLEDMGNVNGIRDDLGGSSTYTWPSSILFLLFPAVKNVWINYSRLPKSFFDASKASPFVGLSFASIADLKCCLHQWHGHLMGTRGHSAVSIGICFQTDEWIGVTHCLQFMYSRFLGRWFGNLWATSSFRKWSKVFYAE